MRPRHGPVASGEDHKPKSSESLGHPFPVAYLAADSQAHLHVIFCLSVTAHKIAELARSPERTAPSEVAPLCPRASQCLHRHPLSQRHQAAMQQVQLQRENQPQTQLSQLFRAVAPRMRREEILPLRIKAREPRALFPAEKLRFRLLRERYVELEVAVTCRLALADLVQPLMRVLAHRFQHRVAGRAPLDAVGGDE